MDKLKDFIDNHREAFDDDLLPERHLEHFEKKLGKKRRLRHIGFAAITMAAAVGLLLLLKTQSGIGDIPLPETLTFTCEAEEEIEELRLYYNMQLYDVESQIKDLYAQKETSAGFAMMEESERIIQTTYDFEANVLPSLPCSDMGVFAMNQHYINSLESLNFMLDQMRLVTHNEYHN
jgi:hypothetical protein